MYAEAGEVYKGRERLIKNSFQTPTLSAALPQEVSTAGETLEATHFCIWGNNQSTLAPRETRSQTFFTSGEITKTHLHLEKHEATHFCIWGNNQNILSP